MSAPLRVGTRSSALARAQSALVARALRARRPGLGIEIVPMTTSGDRDLRPGHPVNFTDALDRALADGTIDLAVHSAKDLEGAIDPRLAIVAVPRRADPHDCLVVRPGLDARELPRGARVGSSSPRRRAQLLRWRPDLRVEELRGNVDTRLARLDERRTDALVLAVAGLRRIGRASAIGRVLPSGGFLPAPGQGALAVLARADDRASARLARSIDHPASRRRLEAERACVRGLGADCHHPVAALAIVRPAGLEIAAEVLSPDGERRLRARRRGPSGAAARVGRAVARDLFRLGARELLGSEGAG